MSPAPDSADNDGDKDDAGEKDTRMTAMMTKVMMMVKTEGQIEAIVMVIRVIINKDGNENNGLTRMKKASALCQRLNHSLHGASSTLTIAFPLFLRQSHCMALAGL